MKSLTRPLLISALALLLAGAGIYLAAPSLTPPAVAEDLDPRFAVGMHAENCHEDHFCLDWNVTNCYRNRARAYINTGETWQECNAGPFAFKGVLRGAGSCPGQQAWPPQRSDPAPGTYGCVKAWCVRAGIPSWTNPHAAVVLPTDDWQDYEAYLRMHIFGIGMGDGGEYANPQSLEIYPWSSWMQAQVAGIGVEPADVTLDTTMQSNVPTGLVYDGESLWVHEAGLLPAACITATVDGVNGHPRALVVYAKYENASPWTNVGTTLDISVHQTAHTETLTIPALEALETHVYVTAVVIDNDNDNRPICVRAEAGGKTDEVCENGPTHGDGLNIYELFLPEVPQGTTAVYVTIESPVENGDSARLIGINVSHQHLE